MVAGRRALVVAAGLALIGGMAGCTDSQPLPDAVAPTVSTGSTVAGGGPALEVVVDGNQVGQETAESVEGVDSGEGAVDRQSDDSSASGVAEPTGDRPTGQAEWVLVVAGASNPYDPLLTAAMADVDALGFNSRISNCDVGAAEAIGMAADGTFTLSAPFDSQAAAADAAAVLSNGQIEAVPIEITVVCPE